MKIQIAPFRDTYEETRPIPMEAINQLARPALEALVEILVNKKTPAIRNTIRFMQP
jgi:hypothetical protein